MVAVFREAEDPVGEQFAMSNVVSMELLLEQPEVALEHGRAEDVVEELRDLGLMEFVRDFLPEPFHSAAGPG